jgi:hypothetical protein
MKNEGKKSDARTPNYRGPKIVEVGDVTALTGSGGQKITDAWEKDGHTAKDWNLFNSSVPHSRDLDLEE